MLDRLFELGGGAGLMCTVESLAIIKQFVYDERIVTAEEMLDALESNWQRYEDLRTLILKKPFPTPHASSLTEARSSAITRKA